MRAVQVVLMIVAVLLLGSHVFQWDMIRVDAVTLALLGLLLVIPSADQIRKVKLGDFEAEIGRDEVARAQAKVAVELPIATEPKGHTAEERVQELLREDPRLALAKVRIGLEEALKRLYAAAVDPNPDWPRLSLGRQVDALARVEVLSGAVAGALRDVIGLANRAIHGEAVETGAAQDLALLGVRLTDELQQLYLDRTLRPVESEVVSREFVDRYEATQYRVITIVPLVENPTKNTYVFDQDALESFLEGYEEYAEFVVKIEPLE